MNIYKISNNCEFDHGDWQEAVVVAESPAEAMKIHPNTNGSWHGKPTKWSDGATLERLGVADDSIPKGIVSEVFLY